MGEQSRAILIDKEDRQIEFATAPGKRVPRTRIAASQG